LSVTQLKQFINDNVDKFYNHLIDNNGKSNLIFYSIDKIILHISKRKRQRAGKFIDLPDIIKTKKQ